MFHTSKLDSLSIMSAQWFISELWHWGVFLASLQRLDDLLLSSCTLAWSQFVCILSQGWSLVAVYHWEVAKFYLIIGGNQSCFAAEVCWPAAAELFWTIIAISRLSLFLENTQCYIVDYLKHLDQIEIFIIDTFYPGKIQQVCSSCTPSACICNCCPLRPAEKILELRLSKKMFLTGCLQPVSTALALNDFLRRNSLMYHILLTTHHKYIKNIAPFSTSIPIQCLTLGTFMIPIQIFCPKYLLWHFRFFFSFSWKSKTIYHLLVMWR